ncbi:zinc finger protein 665-like isoform X4 [Ixodes scapularis]|uniref:zinc finger protein 665-like isoform X4 n=1 Tax=Ixodes scapularis TaxID=6945 RepID=UPI001A9F69B9|nr:zinc finger protein 665-like isoform X4 [Ixodes scapularis]
MRKCCVLTCGACQSDGVSLFSFPKNPRLRSKWVRMVNRDHSSISSSTVVCSRHFPEHLVGTKAKPRLTRGSFPTLQLQEASTASTGGKRLRSRAVSHNAPAISACGAFSSEGVDGLSSSPDHLHVEEATITVVKQEPEEMLDTPTIESLCSEDYSGVSTTPLHLEGEEDRACAVKEEVDSVSAASTCGDGYLEGAVCLHFSAECPVEVETASLRVKEEPDEFAPALGMEGEGKTSEAFDSVSFLPVLLEGQRRDGSLHVIEVPDEILPTPTGGAFRSEDCNRVYCPQPDREGHNKSCVVKQDADDVPEGSSDCGGSHSLSSSQERSDQECLDEQVNPRHGCSFGTWSSISTRKTIAIEGTQTEEASRKHHLTTCERIDTDERPFKCLACPKAFRTKSSLKVHERYHSDEKPFECPYCPKAFQTKSRLTVHKISHSDKRPFKCPSCPKAFKSKPSLAMHKRFHCDKRPFKCPSCPKAFKINSHLTTHKLSHSDERPFKCPTCLKAFQMKSSLAKHKLCHSDERPFKCPICPKAFKKKLSLTTHEISHSDERPFKCPSCPNSYCSQSSLRVHTRLHQKGERTFKCETRDRSFAEKCHLTNNELIHAGPKPFTCSTSSEEFRFRAKLNYHKTIHVPVAYKCPTCPKLFRTKFYLNVHEKLHKNERTCLKDIYQKSSMNSHKTIHECKGTSRCDTCDKLFEQRMGQSRPQPTTCDLPPVAMHTGGRLLKSGAHPKELIDKSSLSLHERLLSGKMPYKSENLDAAFLWKYKQVGCKQSQLIRNHVLCHTSSEALCKESQLSAHGKIHRDELTCNLSTHAVAVTEGGHVSAHQAVYKSEGLSKCPVQPKVVKLNLPLQSKLSFQLKLPFNLLSNYKGTIYKCSICTMAFTNEQHLKAHQVAHLG